MDRQIDSIIVGQRYRKTYGNMDALKASIERVGLLQPIGIDSDNRLVFGERRLIACKSLGWKAIPSRVINLDDPLQAEHDENECREPFTVSERVEIAKAIEAREADLAKKRQREAGGDRGNQHTGGKSGGSEKFSQPAKQDANRSKSKAAAAVGMSRPTLAKAQAVIAAAEENPELQAVVEEMDRTGKVDPAFKKVTATNGQSKPGKIRGSYEDWREMSRLIREVKERLSAMRALKVDFHHRVTARDECDALASSFTKLARQIGG